MAAQYVGRPERLATFTQVGTDFDTIRARYRDLSYDIRKAGYSWSCWWVVERNPKGTGNHVHALCKGQYIPQGDLAKLADGAGFGRVTDIRRLGEQDRGGTYLVKEVAGAYLAKGRVNLEAFLLTNGGRFGHQTRDYFGMPARQADRVMKARYREGTELGSWVLKRVEDTYEFSARERAEDA